LKSDEDAVDEIHAFARNLIDNYLTNKCVSCYPSGDPQPNLTYALNTSLTAPAFPLPLDVRMRLVGAALATEQFITGFTTPCAGCVSGVSGQWNVDVKNATVQDHGIKAEATGRVQGNPYYQSQYGVTYDPLSIWSDVTSLEVDHTVAKKRCIPGSTREKNSIYVVAMSSDPIQHVCCDYVFCICAFPGPREWCTRPLLSASASANADRFNCLNGDLPGGCSCSSDVC
jgi:hypothetical protein